MGFLRSLTMAVVCAASSCGGDDFSAGAGGDSATGASDSAGSPSAASSGGTGNVGGSGGTGGSGGAQPITIVSESGMLETTMLDVPTLTLEAAPAAGNALIVGITCLSTAGDPGGDCILEPGSVSDNQNNVYTRVVQGEPIPSSEQAARAYIFIAENIGAPNGELVISVDPNGASPPEIQSVVFGAIEVAGLAAPPSADASGISLVGGNDATSTNAITDLPTAQANELAIAVLSMRSEDTNMLITPEELGWTAHHVNQNGADPNPPGHSMVSFVTTRTGQVSHTWTHDPPTRGVAAVIATFRGALME